MQYFLMQFDKFGLVCLFKIFLCFFVFLLQKIKDKIIKTRSEIMTTVNNFNEILQLHSDKGTERELILLKKSIKFHEDLANDKDENDVEYLIDRDVYLKNLFNTFLNKYNIDQKPGGSTINNLTFIETPDRIKYKECTINPQNKDSKCFQYSNIISLYHKEIKDNPERTSKIKPFINNLNWENINFPRQEQDYKT